MTTTLEALFDEVSFLALQLRQGFDLPEEERELPAGVCGVLQVLGRDGPRSVPQIARQRRTSRQNIQIVVNRMLKEGRIELSTNPKHKRSGLVGLTDSGKALLTKLQNRSEAVLKEVAGQIGEAELGAAAAVLRKARLLLAPDITTRALAKASPSREKPTTVEESKRARAASRKPARVRPKVQESQAEEEGLPVNLL